MKTISRILSLILICGMVMGLALPATAEENIRTIVLSSQETDGIYTHSATLDGAKVKEYDYTWHADPTEDHDTVKNSPAEYFTGTKPTGEEGVYIAHDVVYYPLLDESKFQKVNYDGEMEWVYLYEAEGYENYIFSTLPVLGNSFPSQMMHSAEDAYENAVLHITEAGTYRLQGTWHGQIRVDLGEDAFSDPSQKVTLILDGVNVTCTVASGVVFANVYECDNTWEEKDSFSYSVDTAEAGARVILADGTVNNVEGTNTFRILRAKYKDDDSTEAYPAQKKQYKLDGAFYSYMSMNIEGESAGTGVLNITSGYEGLNSELHLTLNGGKVNIYSQDDGINVNEDGVSVLTVNGGNLHICAGLGAEGDGIDSNGFVAIRGGTVISAANPGADSGLDSDCGSYVLGGTVVALGATMDWAESDASVSNAQAVLNLRFSGSQSADEAIILTDTEGKVVFAYDPDKDEVMGENGRTYSGAILSDKNLKVGESYHLYVGGNVLGAEESGVYDASTVMDFEGASQQCYGGTAVGGMGGNFQRPDKGQMPQGGQMPNMGAMPQGGQMQTPPDGFDPMQNRGDRGEIMGAQQMNATCMNEKTFTLSKTVNAFSDLGDVRHSFVADGKGYTCTQCGETADTLPEGTLPGAPAEKEQKHGILGYALSFLLGAGVTALGFVLVLTARKKKAK